MVTCSHNDTILGGTSIGTRIDDQSRNSIIPMSVRCPDSPLTPSRINFSESTRILSQKSGIVVVGPRDDGSDPSQTPIAHRQYFAFLLAFNITRIVLPDCCTLTSFLETV